MFWGARIVRKGYNLFLGISLGMVSEKLSPLLYKNNTSKLTLNEKTLTLVARMKKNNSEKGLQGLVIFAPGLSLLYAILSLWFLIYLAGLGRIL